MADIERVANDVSAILKLEVPVIVLLGQRAMRLADVTALVPGSIVELPKGADEELELLVNNKVIGVGKAVKVGENFGVRINYVGDVRARVLAMGEAAAGAGEAAEGGAEESAEAMAERIMAGQLGQAA